VVERLAPRRLEVDPRVLLNVNTPERLAVAERALRPRFSPEARRSPPA